METGSPTEKPVLSHLQSSCLSLLSASMKAVCHHFQLSHAQFPWRVDRRGEIFHDHALPIEIESALVAGGYWQSCPDRPAHLGMSSVELFFFFFFCACPFGIRRAGLRSGTAMSVNRAQCQATSSFIGHRACGQGTWQGDIPSADAICCLSWSPSARGAELQGPLGSH